VVTITVASMSGGEPITIKLQKAAPAIPWGFRLAGGIDFASPLAISMVNGGTIAEKAGLRPGDQVVSIKGAQVFNLRHNEAKEAIKSAGQSFELVVQRGGQSWKPKAPTPPPDSVDNKSIRDVAAQHSQKHNSPIGLYSDDSIAEVMAGQAELVDGAIGVDFKKYEPKEIVVNTNTPTYRLIHGIPDGEPAPAKPRLDPLKPEDETPAWAKGGTQLKGRPDDNMRTVNGMTIPTVGGQQFLPVQ